MRRLPIAAIAAAACIAAGPTLASSAAEAMLGPLTIQLFDLDLNDGISPSVTFAGNDSRAFAVAFNPYGVFDDDQAYGNGPWGDAAASVTLTLSRSAATISGGAADGNGTTLKATGSSVDFMDVSVTSAQYVAEAKAPYINTGAFTLSAGTAMTISGGGSVLAQTSSGNPQYNDEGGAHVYLSLSGPGGSNPLSDILSATCHTLTGDAPCMLTESRTLSVTFSNTAAASISGNLQAAAYVGGYSLASTVPEPAAWALLLAGLSTLRLAARGRTPRRED